MVLHCHNHHSQHNAQQVGGFRIHSMQVQMLRSQVKTVTIVNINFKLSNALQSTTRGKKSL